MKKVINEILALSFLLSCITLGIWVFLNAIAPEPEPDPLPGIIHYQTQQEREAVFNGLLPSEAKKLYRKE